MLGVLRIVEIAPLKKCVGRFSHSSVDRLTILHFPNDERIVLSDASEEFIIRTELQFQNLVLHTTEDSHGPFSLHVPEDDGCVGYSLEHCAFLSCRDDVARVGNSKGADFHVVPAKELLIVLVH